jgi:hypothetical protein
MKRFVKSNGDVYVRNEETGEETLIANANDLRPGIVKHQRTPVVAAIFYIVSIFGIAGSVFEMIISSYIVGSAHLFGALLILGLAEIIYNTRHSSR